MLLTTYSATFSQQSEDSISTNSATDYHQSLDNIFIGLCATVAYAEDPVVISSTLTTINIDKRVTENTESLVYEVTCKNCTSFITHPAHVRLINFLLLTRMIPIFVGTNRCRLLDKLL